MPSLEALGGSCPECEVTHTPEECENPLRLESVICRHVSTNNWYIGIRSVYGMYVARRAWHAHDAREARQFYFTRNNKERIRDYLVDALDGVDAGVDILLPFEQFDSVELMETWSEVWSEKE